MVNGSYPERVHEFSFVNSIGVWGIEIEFLDQLPDRMKPRRNITIHECVVTVLWALLYSTNLVRVPLYFVHRRNCCPLPQDEIDVGLILVDKSKLSLENQFRCRSSHFHFLDLVARQMTCPLMANHIRSLHWGFSLCLARSTSHGHVFVKTCSGSETLHVPQNQ